MTYQVIYLSSTEKFFKKVPRNIALRILNRVEKISLDPLAPDSNIKKLQDPIAGYRLRVGDYRVIYLLDHQAKRLIVSKIAHRSEVYQ